MRAGAKDPVVVHGALSVAVVAVAWAVAALWPAEAEARRTAMVAVALCGGSGAFSLVVKRLARTTNQALGAVGLVFGLRLALVVLGGVLAARVGGGLVPFIFGFFGTYFPLQFVEISYLLAVAKRRGTARETVEQR